MLICLDCEKELRDEYLERIQKENGSKYSIKLKHSKIKRELSDGDNNSTFSRESYYTDNNSYIPNNDKFRTNKRFELQYHIKNNINELNMPDNFAPEQDKLSFHSYNGITTDYSKRRKKNKIKNNIRQIEEIPNNYINKLKDIQYNSGKEEYRYIDENNKNESNNNSNNNKIQYFFEHNKKERNGERYNEIEKDDIYSNKSEKEMIITLFHNIITKSKNF